MGLKQQGFRIGSRLRDAVLLFVERIGGRLKAAAAPATARVANDSEKPRAPVAAGKCPEVSKGTQRRVLHGILRVGLIPHQPARQPIASVKVGQNNFVEAFPERDHMSINSHVASVKCTSRDEHRQHPHRPRTSLVRLPQMSMIPIQNLFETHLPVTDLDRAITFYRDVVGLRLAHVVSARQAAFFWIGPAGNAMLGLWGTGSGPQRMALHTAFRTSLADVIAAPAALRSAGITPLDFDGNPTDQPVVFAWMAAASVFFRDPDGHLLEYIAMLPDAPRPEQGVVPWRAWELMHRAAPTSASSQTP